MEILLLLGRIGRHEELLSGQSRKRTEAFLTSCFVSFFKSVSTREQQKPVSLEALLFSWLGIVLASYGKGRVASEGSSDLFIPRKSFWCVWQWIVSCQEMVASNKNKSVNFIKLH